MDEVPEQRLFNFVDSLDENLQEKPKNIWDIISDAIDCWTVD